MAWFEDRQISNQKYWWLWISKTEKYH